MFESEMLYMKLKKLLIIGAVTACLTMNFVACSSEKNMTDMNTNETTDSVDKNSENLKDDIVNGAKDIKDDIMDSADSSGNMKNENNMVDSNKNTNKND